MNSTENATRDALNPVVASNGKGRGTRILNALEASINEAHGRKLALRELATFASISTSTLFDWLTGSPLRQLETLFHLLELLPRGKRQELVNRACRTLPSVWHRRIAWSERQVTCLERLLALERGFTLVAGQEDAAGFLVSALGHSSWRLGSKYHPVSGVDARIPTRFVPVAGVVYLHQPEKPADIIHQFANVWPILSRNKGHLVLLHGVWPTVTGSEGQILALGESSHVVLSTSSRQEAQRLMALAPAPCHFIDLRETKNRRLEITIRAR